MRHLASLVALALAAAAPAGAMVITTLDQGLSGGSAVAYGPNGLALISYDHFASTGVRVAACHDAACTSATFTSLDPGATNTGQTGIAFGADGRAVIGYSIWVDSATSTVKVAHCADAQCTTATLATVETASGLGGPAIAMGSDGLPILAYGDGTNLRVAHCADAGCTTSTVTVFAGRIGVDPSITIGGDGRAVVACDTGVGPSIHLGHCTDVSCSSATFITLAPNPFPNVIAHRLPSLATRSGGLVAMAYEYEFGSWPEIQTSTRLVGCVDAACTAVQELPGGYGGRFFDPALAFLPGDRPLIAHKNGTLNGQGLSVTLCPDPACAPVPQLTVDNTTAYHPSLAVDPSGIGLVVYDTGDLKVAYLSTNEITIGDAARLEGDAGTAEVAVEVRASDAGDAVVFFSTAAGSATSGVDFLPTSGALTFTTATASRIVRVLIVGDTNPEANEAFVVNLSVGQGAVLADGQATVTIVDDDVAAAGIDGELASGARVTGDLASLGGVPDVDLFRFSQTAHASYEVVVDGLSGDLTPVVLARTSGDGTTVLQGADSVGTGAVASLRWRNGASPVANQLIRLASGGCQTDCGADDTYRLRAYETTLRGPRFNQSGSQATVVLLQNAGDVPVDLTVDFWSDAGALLASTAASAPLAPRGLVAIDAGSLPALAGKSGSLTVSHTGSYGSLVGKAVALEPATGASFDTPLEPWLR
jgi:Calx-beta domain-containing protein